MDHSPPTQFFNKIHAEIFCKSSKNQLGVIIVDGVIDFTIVDCRDDS
jgi:hypothetical protein